MRNRTIYLVLAAVVLALFAACAPAAPPPAPTPTPAPAVAPTKAPPPPTATPAPVAMKFGTTGTADNMGVYLGLEKGYFKEQGINLEQVIFPSAAQVVAPLGTGEVDVGGLVISPALLNAADRGIGTKVVADRGGIRPGFEAYWIMLRKDLADSGQVKTPADLKGQKITIINRGSMGHQTVELMLAQAGLAEKDVAGGAFEILSFPDQVAAYGNKAIAAGFLVDPFATASALQGVAVKWVPASRFFPGGSVQVAFVGYSSKLAKDADLGRRWLMAYLKGMRDYQQLLKTEQGKVEIRATIAKYTPSKDLKLLEAMEPPYLDPNGAVDKASLNFQYEWMVKGGFYTGKTSFNDMVDTSFLDYTVQRLGKYQ